MPDRINELSADVTRRSAIVARLKTKKQSENAELVELERRRSDARADGAEPPAESVESMIRAVETRLRRTENALGEAERRLAGAKEQLLSEQRRTADERARTAGDEAVPRTVDALRRASRSFRLLGTVPIWADRPAL